MSDDALLDHIGVDFFEAFRAFERAMFASLDDALFGDVSVADSEVLVFVGAAGTRVTTIAAARRITKQAASEHVQSLVRRDYLTLMPDPGDRRARLVQLSDKGRALSEALRARKAVLDRQVKGALGVENYADLRAALAQAVEVLKTSG